MSIAISILLLICSALLLWRARPISQWSGESAALFASALILFLHACLLPFQIASLDSAQLLLAQLSAYAAIPLLLSAQLTLALGYALSRMMWGRILLGWCVVFELMRQNHALDLLSMILLISGIVIAALSLFQQRNTQTLLVITAWSFMTLKTFLMI